MTKMSGARALVESLRQQGVKVIFGIIGGAIMPTYDALYDSDIRHILSRHEQCAAHAADGYARVTGRPGVCMATSGPGATNLVTGIANAYMDSSPIIALTGQVSTRSASSSYMIGKDAFQEADIIGITTPITKFNYQVRSAAEIPKAIKTAFYIATTGRPGPVLLDLPKDVQMDTAEMDFSSMLKIRGYKYVTDPHPLQVKKAAELLLNAERPVILAGGGITISGAFQELLELAEFIQAPVATTLMGKGCFPENHPLAMGHIGMHGNPVANKLILEADVLLAVGTRFADRSTGRLDTFCKDAKIIHVDIDPAEISKNIEPDVPIVADAKKALKAIHMALTENLRTQKTETPWVKRIKEVKETFAKNFVSNADLSPKVLLRTLRELLPEDAIITTEVGQNQMWAALHFQVIRPRTYITSGGLGTMGFGFPAALGAKVACPDRIVVDIAGDGSFIMTEQELACSVEEEIPVIVIILNNSVLGMVAQWQRLFYGRRYIAVKLGRVPDFVKLAEAYGAQGIRVASLEDFKKAVKAAMKSDVTTVIDVPVSPEEDVLPMVPPERGLNEMLIG